MAKIRDQSGQELKPSSARGPVRVCAGLEVHVTYDAARLDGGRLDPESGRITPLRRPRQVPRIHVEWHPDEARVDAAVAEYIHGPALYAPWRPFGHHAIGGGKRVETVEELEEKLRIVDRRVSMLERAGYYGEEARAGS